MAQSAPSGFGALFERLGRRIIKRSEEPQPEEALSGEGAYEDHGARQALALMMAEAADVLKRLGLPHQAGFYRQGPHQSEWSFLSATMTPAERWAMVLDTPPGAGWRYGTLPQVVRAQMPDLDAVRQAADVLEQGAACLNAADHNGSGGFDPAIALAVAWAGFQIARRGAVEAQDSPLKLYFPPEDIMDSAPPPPSKTLRIPESSKKPRPAANPRTPDR